MNYLDTLTSSVGSVRERDERFGPAEEVFNNTAKLASIMLGMKLTSYDIVTILRCLNDARKIRDRLGSEHYVENVNLEAFALQFATNEARQNLEARDRLESDMAAEVAKQFSPTSVNVGVTVGVGGVGTTTPAMNGEASQ